MKNSAYNLLGVINTFLILYIIFLLIAFCFIIFEANTSSGMLDDAEMEKTAVRTFNEKILKYEGEQEGRRVKSLIQEVNSVNGNLTNIDIGRCIKIIGIENDSDSEYLYYKSSGIKSSLYYIIKIESYNEDGRINEISIEPKK